VASEIITTLPNGKLLVEVSTTGPSSYSSGGFSVSVDILRVVEKVVAASCTGGYKVDAATISISGNTLTVPVYYYDYSTTTDGPATEVAADTNLSGVTFKFLVIGV